MGSPHRMDRLWKFKSIEVDEWVMAGGAVDSGDFQEQRKA